MCPMARLLPIGIIWVHILIRAGPGHYRSLILIYVATSAPPHDPNFHWTIGRIHLIDSARLRRARRRTDLLCTNRLDALEHFSLTTMNRCTAGSDEKPRTSISRGIRRAHRRKLVASRINRHVWTAWRVRTGRWI